MDIIRQGEVNSGTICCNFSEQCGNITIQIGSCNIKNTNCKNGCDVGSNNCFISVSCKGSCA